MTNGSRLTIALALVAALGGCGDGAATVQKCEPEGSCACTAGTQRATQCTCQGGSDCSIDGDNIEFQCDGNAACGLTCGKSCLITCPGTTTCTVDTGEGGAVSCPGTATCDVTCRGSCTVQVTGAARAIVRCPGAAMGATCSVTGCTPMTCPNHVSVCGTACP